jgi:phage terminase large subunit-like protein
MAVSAARSSAVALDAATFKRWYRQPITFIEEVLRDPDTDKPHKPYKLLPAEKLFLSHMFALDADGRLLYPDLIYSTPKKRGKTTWAAVVTLTMLLLYGRRHAEAYLAANDLEQATMRVFEMKAHRRGITAAARRGQGHRRSHQLRGHRRHHHRAGQRLRERCWSPSMHFSFR